MTDDERAAIEPGDWVRFKSVYGHDAIDEISEVYHKQGMMLLKRCGGLLSMREVLEIRKAVK